jgi:hypothetical protein
LAPGGIACVPAHAPLDIVHDESHHIITSMRRFDQIETSLDAMCFDSIDAAVDTRNRLFNLGDSLFDRGLRIFKSPYPL